MRVHPSFMKFLAATIVIAALVMPVAAQEPAKAEAPAAAPAATGPKPQVVVPQPIAELGDVTYGESRKLEFAIKNTGDDVLRIHAAKSACGCVVTEFSKEIAPGAEGKIDVQFEAALSGGPTAVPIEVVTNDPDSPTLQLTIKANVRYYVTAQPGFVRYLIVQGFDGDSVVKQTLYAAEGSPMKVVKVESPYDFITTSFRELTPAERLPGAANVQQWVVETRISPDAPIGPLNGFLTIHVDHPKQKLVKLAVNGFVRPMFAVTPAQAGGKITIKEKGARESLYVKNFAEENVVVTGAESTVAGITPRIAEEEAGRIYWVILEYAPDMAKGDFAGVVRIKTASPKKPVIEVPLRGTIL
jgi:hypothetical protein